jgi:hypothetical protein
MNAEQRTWSLVVVVMCATLIACIFIMARCSVDSEMNDTRIADCIKAGGHWNYNGGESFCQTSLKTR